MAFKKGHRSYPKTKDNSEHIVGYGKYANRQFHWVAKKDLIYFRAIQKLYYSKYSDIRKKNYDKIFKEYCETKDKYLEKKNDIVDIWVTERKKNKGLAETRMLIEKRYPGISMVFIQQCLIESKEIMHKEFETERDFMVDIHNLRYEELFDQACNPDLRGVQPWLVNSVLAESLNNAIDVLVQKEKTLGLHSKTFKFQINNYLQQKRKKKVQVFNFELISLEQQIELLHIIESCRVGVILQRPVVDNRPQAPVMTQAKVVELIEAPIQRVPQEDKIGKEMELVEKKAGKTYFEVQQDMKQTLDKQIEEAMKKIKKKK